MEDLIVEHVLQFTESGMDYKSFCLVSKQWHSVIMRLFPRGGKFVNHLATLLKLYPDENWDYVSLVAMPGYKPWEQRELQSMIIKIFGYDSYYSQLSQNPNITPETVRQTQHGWWSRYGYSINPNLTREDILSQRYADMIDFCWLSLNKNVTWDIVQEFPGMNWNYGELARNLNITWDIVNSNPVFADIRHAFSGSPNVTWEIVTANPDVTWDFEELSKHIPWEIIKANPDYEWCPWEVSKNPTVTWEIIQNNPDYGWTPEVSQNPNITWDIVEANPGYRWNYEYMALNPNITWYNVHETYNRNWSFHMLSGNRFGK